MMMVLNPPIMTNSSLKHGFPTTFIWWSWNINRIYDENKRFETSRGVIYKQNDPEYRRVEHRRVEHRHVVKIIGLTCKLGNLSDPLMTSTSNRRCKCSGLLIFTQNHCFEMLPTSTLLGWHISLNAKWWSFVIVLLPNQFIDDNLISQSTSNYYLLNKFNIIYSINCQIFQR